MPPDAPEGIGGFPAGPLRDFATGFGLADAYRAAIVARFRRLIAGIGPPMAAAPMERAVVQLEERIQVTLSERTSEDEARLFEDLLLGN